MRETRLSGSEGGEATAFPTPIAIGSDFDVALIENLNPQGPVYLVRPPRVPNHLLF